MPIDDCTVASVRVHANRYKNATGSLLTDSQLNSNSSHRTSIPNSPRQLSSSLKLPQNSTFPSSRKH